MMIIFIAGIQNIPEELVEAAKIDGAGRGKTLTSVTIPLIMPSITITLFMSLTNSFRMFDQNLSLTAGLPGKRTAMVALDIYNTFYSRSGWEGVGQAKAMLFFLMVVVLSLIQLSITRKREIEN
jgi:raffinose/stachyose/melibiose transport system permease protein